jgi:hypothetical protein
MIAIIAAHLKVATDKQQIHLDILSLLNLL